MFTSEDGFGGGTLIPNAQRLYETTIHELAHASHFDIDHSDFRNTDEMSIESWAVGVAWSFARLQYTSAMSLQDLRINNATDNFDIVHWGERQYTPLVIDLIDNINQRTSNNGNTDFPIDNVSGYTIKQIEDALKTKRTMNAWRDNIKSMFNNSTENSVDELFLNYTNVQ